LLATYSDSAEQPQDKNLALISAAEKGHLDKVQTMLERYGAEISENVKKEAKKILEKHFENIAKILATSFTPKEDNEDPMDCPPALLWKRQLAEKTNHTPTSEDLEHENDNSDQEREDTLKKPRKS
jgi:hypothetical protein